MGNSLSGVMPSQIFPVDHYFTELPEFTFDTNLGSTRFLKVARAKYNEQLVVVKVFANNDLSLPLQVHKKSIEEIKNHLNKIPNCLPFAKVIIHEKAAILVRQYIQHNLYDRISTRPFLSMIEKRWIAFQLLYVTNQIHRLNIHHGDIKLENILVTGWNWVLLSDLASFKPTYLDEENPADYNYFFDTSRRRTCYIAPERFVKSSSTESTSTTSCGILPEDEVRKGDLTNAMDIFSLGCVLIELFTDGQAPFDFSQLLNYNSSDTTPAALDKIKDPDMKMLVSTMIQRDPKKRLEAEDHLQLQRGKAFPEYFYTNLKDYIMGFATTISADEKVLRIKKDTQIIIDFTKEKNGSQFQEGLVLIVAVVTSCLRTLKHCTAKLKALECLKDFAPYLAPEIILDRLLPYLLEMTKDPYPQVRVSAIKIIDFSLKLVKTVPHSDAHVFPEYILKTIDNLSRDEAVIVRIACAEVISSLAETSLKYLEMSQCVLDLDDSDNDLLQTNYSKVSYDKELRTLHEIVQQSVSNMLSDPENIVKQTLLVKGITPLCVFFGQQKANDVLLSHIITFLNDKMDNRLRASFFEGVEGVASYIGCHCAQILKPLLLQGCNDPEEFVAEKSLQTLSNLTKIGIFSKYILLDITKNTIPLLCHPNLWIRQGMVGFVCEVSKILNIADINCKLKPMLVKYTNQPNNFVGQEALLLKDLKKPLPRYIFTFLAQHPNLGPVLQYLNHRQVSRFMSTIKSDNMELIQDPKVNQAYKRLLAEGVTEELEEIIMYMKDHLTKINQNKKRSHEKSENLSIIDLSTLKNIKQKVYSFNLVPQEQLNAVKKSTDSQGTTHKVNEDWQTMFAPSDVRMSSPKPLAEPSDTQYTGSTSPVFNLADTSEKLTTQYLQNLVPLVGGDKSAKYQCVSCQEVFSNFVRRKQIDFCKEQSYKSIPKEQNRVRNLNRNSIRFKGEPIAHIHEHRGGINRITVIPNTELFATCSQDGTVKIWDGKRIEGKGTTNRSRHTYSKMEGQLTSLVACQHQLAAASTSGDIHVFNFDAGNGKTNIVQTRGLDLYDDGYVVDMNYYDSGNQGILVYATVRGQIVGWDLRAPNPANAWKLKHNLSAGVITTFCIEASENYLLAGTSNGKMICWDLRFNIPITTISHPFGTRIHKVMPHPIHPACVFAAMEGGNEISLWDIETSSRKMTLWGSQAPPFTNHRSFKGAHAMHYGSTDRGDYLLSAGTDMKVRLWDLTHPHLSRVIINSSLHSNPPVVEFSQTLVDGIEVIKETIREGMPKKSGEESPNKYPEPPSPGHHDCINDIAIIPTYKPMLATGSCDGVVKLWK